MKRQPFIPVQALSYYLDLVNAALSKHDYALAIRYGETALKKLHCLPGTALDKYHLYTKLGLAYYACARYSRALDVLHDASLIALKNNLGPAYVANISSQMGSQFLATRNIAQALNCFEKVAQYYEKYGDAIPPMNKRMYITNLMGLAYCYLYKNELARVGQIVEKEIPPLVPSVPMAVVVLDYNHLKGEYLLAQKEYDKAYQAFQNCIKISQLYHPAPGAIEEAQIHLAVICILRNRLEESIRILEALSKEATRLKFNSLTCESALLLGMCYRLKNMPLKAEAIERQIKPMIKTLEILWFYEKKREFERLYADLQLARRTPPTTIKSAPAALTDGLNHRYETSTYKDVIVGQSMAIHEIFQLVEKIAPSDLPVLIQGATGTGKELIARAIHQTSRRNNKPYLIINCGAVPETLLESELFGYAKGAFTDARANKKGYLELASGGTLFIDEVGNMSLSMQQKLLRILEEKLVWPVGSEKSLPVDVRFILATNQSLDELVRQKSFRPDLYYRINTLVINLPVLSERKEDIPLLVRHFLKKYAQSEIRPASAGQSAIELLVNYDWPGNVRELENEIKRLCTLHPDVKTVTGDMLSVTIRRYIPSGPPPLKGPLRATELLAEYERKIITESLTIHKGNIALTARSLGYARRQFYRRLKHLKIHFT
ncbi:MAG: sigma 54-interacting transcriptional regulator [Planctomycetes bacterium]|nr:sigma 54-interacting transcriptional regulator [Planctomycetota bacterium]